MLDMVYPDICVGCGIHNCIKNDVFCISCKRTLLTTDHFEVSNNEVIARLSGRVNILHGAAMYYFVKDGKIQRAIHHLKYGKRKDIGFKIGKQFGRKLNNSDCFAMPDLIIPIPVHPKREWRRGYNQSKIFADGIEEEMGIKVIDNILIKKENLDSQTAKHRADRFENVFKSFELRNQHLLEGQSILLADDVLTTGATLEAAIQMLAQIPNITIQIALIALANEG